MPRPAADVLFEHVALRWVQAVRQLGLEGVLVLEALPNTPAYDAGIRSTYRCIACTFSLQMVLTTS
jgi:S1-C subfamily serine protease